jgi:bifunctional aspartokinase / homoserine dehydrogenase 1
MSSIDKAHWQVHKFGGTSVASADCYRKCADILAGFWSDSSLAIVVSAMGGKPKTTDLLLDAVKYASQRNNEAVEEALQYVWNKHDACCRGLLTPSEAERLIGVIESDIKDIRDVLKTVALMKWQAQRISEVVSGYGELWSAQILTSLLRDVQTRSDKTDVRHEFVYIDARRVIVIDEEAAQDGAVVWDVSQQKLREVYTEESSKIQASSNTRIHLVITGYVASNTQGVATTLQRDGSDYSAAIIGRLLQSQSITIWTDVDGVLSADPRRVPLAQVLSQVSYNEAMELAYFGAKVIHPKTMQPAISSNPPIPIYIRNTFNPSFVGTRIYTTSSSHSDRDKVVCGFSSVEGMALVNVEGSGLVGVPGVSRRIFQALEQRGINVALISQGSSEHSVTLATSTNQAMLAKEAIEEAFDRELKQDKISCVDIVTPCSIIAAVGDGMATVTGVSGRFFSALGDAKINVLAIAQGSSERNISAVVKTEESTRALRAVHAAFRLSHTTIRVAIIGMNELGISLLELLESQRSQLKTVFDIDLQVCAVVPESASPTIIALKKDDDTTGSITMECFEKKTSAQDSSVSASFVDGAKSVAEASHGGLQTVLGNLIRNESPSHVVFDCTNDEIAGKYHAVWLRSNVDVVTANNTGLSGPREQREDISLAEKLNGKNSAKYLREVTVGGGLPIINTLRSLLHSGDRIHRVDGILSVTMSFVMFRISPPPEITQCSEFDEKMSNGAFRGDLSIPTVKVGQACSFSQAIKEAISLGLTESDPTQDLNNEYTARVLMVLAKELDMDNSFETSTIRDNSDKLYDGDTTHINNITEAIDQSVKERVDAAKSRHCVLRHIASVDVKTREITIRIVEVPEHHVFAVTPPSCECVRFFTQRHRRYPLTIQGPSAGADSTASALLAELVQLMRGKATPRSLALARTSSGAQLRRNEASFVNRLAHK